jgi:argininosuccinate lyase
MQVSPIYAQLSRGKFEMPRSARSAMQRWTCVRLAWDLSLFTSAESGFVSLPAQVHDRQFADAEQA